MPVATVIEPPALNPSFSHQVVETSVAGCLPAETADLRILRRSRSRPATTSAAKGDQDQALHHGVPCTEINWGTASVVRRDKPYTAVPFGHPEHASR